MLGIEVDFTYRSSVYENLPGKPAGRVLAYKTPAPRLRRVTCWQVRSLSKFWGLDKRRFPLNL